MDLNLPEFIRDRKQSDHATATRNKRKCRIGNNLNQANITLNNSTDFVLQPAIEANCKRPIVYSLICDLQHRVIKITVYSRSHI